MPDTYRDIYGDYYDDSETVQPAAVASQTAVPAVTVTAIRAITPSTVSASAGVGAADVSTAYGTPVTVDLRFLEEATAFTRAFDGSFRTTDENDPIRRVTGDVVEQERYGFVPQARPDKPLWRKFFYQPAPLGLLLFKADHRIKLVANFTDPEYVDADAAIMGGQLYVAPSNCWQVALLEEWGFTVVPMENLNAPPYVLSDWK